MILRKCDMKTFSKKCNGKRLACYGIGGFFDRIMLNYEGYEWQKNIEYLVDGSLERSQDKEVVNGREYKIYHIDEFINLDLSDVIVFVTCNAYAEVVDRLNAISKLDNIECYLFHFMYGFSEGEHIQISNTKEMLIPPVIHYCWFGGNDMPDLYKRCIESWHKYCPDYEIKEWNESNCDVSETLFTKQAYDVGKYGFVPDYFRLKIIYEHGGIYLDTDVEVLRNLDDLRRNKAFCGMECPGEPAFGLGFGAISGHPVINKLMQRYKKQPFIKDNGKYDETISPIYQSQDLMNIGMKYGTKLQNIADMIIYPVEVLSPKSATTGEIDISPYSYTMHHYDGSWVSGKDLELKLRTQANNARIQAMFI